MLKLPPLNAVRVFEVAGRHGNFTRAALELGISQSAVSYQVDLLERRLDVTLFKRRGRRVELSEPGRELSSKLSACFNEMAAAFGRLQDDDGSTLRVSTTFSVAAKWLGPRLDGFRSAAPNLSVDVETGNSTTAFPNDDVDVALRVGVGPWPGLRQHFLFRWHSTPMCAPGFRDAHDIREPRDLLRVERITPGEPAWKIWMQASGISVEEQISSASSIGFDNQIADALAAQARGGVALLTPTFWEKELEQGSLVRLFGIDAYENDALWLVYPEARRNAQKIRKFRDWLLAEVADDEQRGPATT